MVKIHCSFSVGKKFWIVTSPLSDPTNVRSMIRSTFRRGLPEDTVSFILKETLKALDYMHGAADKMSLVHLNVRPDSIFIDEEYSSVKLVPALLSYAPNNESSAVDFPGWAVASEVLEDIRNANSKSGDVWMFGLLVVELFYGKIVSGIFGLSAKKNIGSVFLAKLGCFSEAKRRKKMPEELREVVAACLSGEAEKRPTTSQLMEFRFQKDFPAEPYLAKLMEASN